MNSYLTLLKRGEAEITINKSRFISVSVPVDDAEQAMTVLQAEKERFKDATHHCYAYIVGADGNSARFSDDGEPSGTAGVPILDVMRKQKLTGCVTVVTRYFGGILLGAGGLVRAYGKSAAASLQAAGTGLMEPTLEFTCAVPFKKHDRVKSEVQRSKLLQLMGTEFSVNAVLTLRTRERDLTTVMDLLNAAGDGEILISEAAASMQMWLTE